MHPCLDSEKGSRYRVASTEFPPLTCSNLAYITTNLIYSPTPTTAHALLSKGLHANTEQGTGVAWLFVNVDFSLSPRAGLYLRAACVPQCTEQTHHMDTWQVRDSFALILPLRRVSFLLN